LPLRGPDEVFRRRLRGRALAAILLVGGCSAYERAEIEVSLRPSGARELDGALLIPSRPARKAPDAARNGAANLRLTLGASGGTSRAELGLVTSALEFVGAHGRARSVVDGLAHFDSEGTWPRVVIRMDNASFRQGEVWLLDRTWAMRRLGCGATLVWEGELGPVLERLAVVLRSAGGP
jgi:hypothetical protein